MKYVIFMFLLFANSLCAQKWKEFIEFDRYLGTSTRHGVEDPSNATAFEIKSAVYDSLYSFAVYEINVASNGKIDSWRLVPDSDVNFTPRTKAYTEAIMKKASEEFTFKYFQGRMLYPFCRLCWLDQKGKYQRKDRDENVRGKYFDVIMNYSYKHPWHIFFMDINWSFVPIGYCTWLY